MDEYNGNIDLSKRPVIRNPDGSYSTVKTMVETFWTDGQNLYDKPKQGLKEINYVFPQVTPDGKYMTREEALNYFLKTGQHLGYRENVDEAIQYSKDVHTQQERMYANSQPTVDLSRPIMYRPGMNANTLYDRYQQIARWRQ